MCYYFSKYNLICKEDDYILLFNQITNASVVLKSENYDRILNQHCNDNDLLLRLNELGILVQNNINEFSLIENKFIDIQTQRNEIGFYRILLTTFCNANCGYCYEKELKQMSINDNVIDALIDFIVKESCFKKKIILEWFGGEPLLEYKKISLIINKLKFKLTKKLNIESRMVSNGLLFYMDEVKNASLNWNLKSIQISLDGTKEKYEKIKGYKIINAFEKTIDNIKYLIHKGIHVSIRLNYDEKNYLDIIELIKYLHKTFKDTTLFVYASRIFKDTDCFAYTKDKTIDKLILQELFNNDFMKNVFNSMRIRFGCFANKVNGGAILPNGDVYPCSLSAKNSKYRIGNIIINEMSLNNDWLDMSLDDRCKQCNVLPLCGGGCRLAKLSDNNYCVIDQELIIFILRLKLKDFIKNIK